MKIEVKRNLIIFRRPHEWETITEQLIKTHGASIMISWKMRRELGFTVRRHKGLVKRGDQYDNEESIDGDLRNRYYYEEQVHLDFFSESALTYFLLKYVSA